MSHLYELGLSIGSMTTNAGFLTIVAGSARAEIREITVHQLATADRIEAGLGRPAAAGTGTITGTALQPCDPADPAANTKLVLAGGFATTQPTIPANYLRRYLMGAVVGAGMTWTWEPGELVLAPSGQLVLWQIYTTTGATGDVFVRVAE